MRGGFYDLDKRDRAFMVAAGTGGHGSAKSLHAAEMNAACNAWLEKRGLRTEQSYQAQERADRRAEERRERR